MSGLEDGHSRALLGRGRVALWLKYRELGRRVRKGSFTILCEGEAVVWGFRGGEGARPKG